MRVPVTLAVLIIGAATALVSQFALDDWASVSQLGDWIQHGMIFWGGLAVGTAMAALRRLSHGGH
jgi:hypothetical protein